MKYLFSITEVKKGSDFTDSLYTLSECKDFYQDSRGNGFGAKTVEENPKDFIVFDSINLAEHKFMSILTM